MRIIAERITNSLAARKIVPYEDKELYVYGFHQGFLFLINILTIFLIGYAYGMMMESLAFLLAYMPLRSYAGGYHANTPFRCYVLSIPVIIAALAVIRSPFWNVSAAVLVMILVAVVIIVLAPVEDPNKPLDAQEKSVYKKRTIIILGVLIVACVLFWLIGQRTISVCVIVAAVVSALMLIVGKVKNAL